MHSPDELLQRYVEVWNDQDGQGLADLYHPDAERVSPLGTVRGGDGVRGFAAGLWRASPDLRIRVTHSAVNGNVLLYEFTDEGTHTGPLATPRGEVMGSGRHFRIEGAGVVEMRDDRIASERVYFDPGSFLRQLGIGG
jgi:ketosteroid isomerase-like protein